MGDLISSTIENAEKHDVSKFEEYELESVIDGDTIRIKYNGSPEKVRFLLVDTPETNHETLGEQPYGPEAKEFTKQLLAGLDTVYLEFDVSYRDKYKRLLAYIYTASCCCWIWSRYHNYYTSYRTESPHGKQAWSF